jgi:hypothetical protein
MAACLSRGSRATQPLLTGAIVATPANRSLHARCVDRAEIAPFEQESLDEALRRLRPAWLRVSPSQRGISEPARASVYTDDNYSGELDVLRNIPASVAIDVRYLPPVEARNRFGPGCRCAGGVILVRARTSP